MTDLEPPFDLLAIGRSSIDLYANEIGAPFVEIESFAAYVGGSPTNIAVGARRLGLRSALLTALGEDLVGDFILRFLEEESVATEFIPRKPGYRSSAVLLGIEPPDKFPLIYYRGAAADIQIDIDDVAASPVAEATVLEVSGMALSQEPSRSATIFACEQAQAAGNTVLLDLDFRSDQWHDPRAYGLAVRGLLPLVDVVLGTEEEIKAAMLRSQDQLRITHSQITNPEVEGDLEASIGALLERGPEVLVAKRGERGATVYPRDGSPQDVPGFPVEVYNVLGAGDAFASGFIYGVVKGWDWYQASRMGNAAGAIVVTRHGCANFMPYEDEALQFIEEHGGF